MKQFYLKTFSGCVSMIYFNFCNNTDAIQSFLLILHYEKSSNTEQRIAHILEQMRKSMPEIRR